MARKGYKVGTITLPDGSRKYIYAKTKKELDAKILQARLELRAGVDLKNHDTFDEFAEMWFNAYKKGKVRPQTEAAIKRALRLHVSPIIGRTKLSKITPMQCAIIFKEMDAKKLGAGFEKHVHSYLSQIFEVAVDNGLIIKSPMGKSVKTSGEAPAKKEALTPEQEHNFLENIKRFGAKDECFCILALETGMRRGEIMALKWEDIDMEKRDIYVHATAVWAGKEFNYEATTKTDAGTRMIPMTAKARQAFLQLSMLKNGDYIFNKNGEPYNGSDMDLIHRHIKKAGTGIADCSAHILRHTAITKWFMQGMDIKTCQYLAGHSNSIMTLNVYTSYLVDAHYKQTKEKMCAEECTTSVPQQGYTSVDLDIQAN